MDGRAHPYVTGLKAKDKLRCTQWWYYLLDLDDLFKLFFLLGLEGHILITCIFCLGHNDTLSNILIFFFFDK